MTCVAIALVEAGRPVVGVIHDPMRGETFAATDDGPATLNGRTIGFNTGSAGITKAGQTVLKSLVAPLKAGGAARVVIGGYTDNVGDAKANLRLSKSRANSVKVFLVKRGVNAKRLIARGYGETKPIAPNSTEAGRQKNRRIEFTVLGG